MRYYKYIRTNDIEYKAAVCSKRENSFYKDFIVVNGAKSGSCLGLLK